jgi:transcription elongation GreA/GreB family factor
VSVAFRRESDEEHKEPKFELPIPAGPNLVTATGLALIESRIAAFDARLATTDDAEAAEAIRRDLRYWKTRRATAVPTSPPADDSVGFGSVVEIAFNGKARQIAIVGDDEADPHVDRIAFSAPLARALLQGEAGDVLPFAGRDDAIRIVRVDNRG